MQKRKTKAVAEVQPARRKRRSQDDLVRRILDVAAEEFQQNGYARATTAAIARNAEVTEAQLFRYFGSKANLFREAVFNPLDEQLQQFISDEAPDAVQTLDLDERAALYTEELQRFLQANAEMLTTLVVAQKYDREMAAAVGEIKSLAAYFDRGASTMSRRVKSKPEVEPKLMVRVSFAAVLGCVMFKDWIFPPGLAKDDEIRRAIDVFVTKGIAANFD